MEKEINILLLGEIGVGKSTFINAFANYLKFETLDEAKHGEMEVLITSRFTMMDEEYNTREIKVGADDKNERTEPGVTSTQYCRSYIFPVEENKLVIRLIDTPGIDNINFDNILKHIGRYNHLNGICILLRSNNSRLTVVFRFCIQELLSQLHKDAKDNIVFCFTNARSAFYRPGDTLPPLRKQLKDLKNRSNVEIVTNQSTMYCFDSESFQFLSAIKKGITFTDDEEQSFKESWKRSVKESDRLIEYIASRTPHKVKDTLSLNNARRRIIDLSQTLAKMRQHIQKNISIIKAEVERNHQSTKELEDRLNISLLDHNYSVECDLMNNPKLQGCDAMNSSGICTICKCSWGKHMHITYDCKTITKKFIDKNVEKEIKEKQSFRDKKKVIIEDYQKMIIDLKEQKTMNEINVKFAQFLRQNAIAVFNDAYTDYLDLFISHEKGIKSSCPKNYDNKILEGLETSRREYTEKVAIIKKAIENNDFSSSVSPDEIAELEQRLYSLPINGESLRKTKEPVENNAHKVKEVRYKTWLDFFSNLRSKILI